MQSIPDFRRSLELDTADAEYTRSLKNDPSLIDAWRMRSRIAMERQRNEDAEKLLKQGLEYNPGELVLTADLANLCLLRRDAVSARPWVEQLMGADAEKPEHVFSQARLLWIEGDYEGALASFRKAAEKKPGERRYAMSLIQTLVSLGDIPAALADLERWQDGGASGEMFALLALCRYDTVGLDAALDVVAGGLSRIPDHGYLHYLHAVLLTLAGQTAKARYPISLIETDERMGPRWRGFKFAREHGGKAPFCGLESTLLRKALAASPADGAVLEFGVYHGLSLQKIAQHVTAPIHGFDSFEGLPEDWKPGESGGATVPVAVCRRCRRMCSCTAAGSRIRSRHMSRTRPASCASCMWIAISTVPPRQCSRVCGP